MAAELQGALSKKYPFSDPFFPQNSPDHVIKTPVALDYLAFITHFEKLK